MNNKTYEIPAPKRSEIISNFDIAPTDITYNSSFSNVDCPSLLSFLLFPFSPLINAVLLTVLLLEKSSFIVSQKGILSILFSFMLSSSPLKIDHSP